MAISDEIRQIARMLELLKEARTEIEKLKVEGEELRKLRDAMLSEITGTPEPGSVEATTQVEVDAWFYGYFGPGGAGKS